LKFCKTLLEFDPTNQHYEAPWKLLQDPRYVFFLECYGVALVLIVIIGFLYSTYFSYPTFRNQQIYTYRRWILCGICCDGSNDTDAAAKTRIRRLSNTVTMVRQLRAMGAASPMSTSPSPLSPPVMHSPVANT